jgi:hypothetical protein
VFLTVPTCRRRIECPLLEFLRPPRRFVICRDESVRSSERPRALQRTPGRSELMEMERVSSYERDPSTHALPASAATCGMEGSEVLSRGRCRSRDLAPLSHSEVPSQRHCSCTTCAARSCSLRPPNFAPTQETIPIGSPQRRATAPGGGFHFMHTRAA